MILRPLLLVLTRIDPTLPMARDVDLNEVPQGSSQTRCIYRKLVYHFLVSRNHVMTPTDANLIRANSNHPNRGRLPLEVIKRPESTANMMHRQVFQYYDFIEVTERTWTNRWPS
jgi:hypothetical protein